MKCPVKTSVKVPLCYTPRGLLGTRTLDFDNDQETGRLSLLIQLIVLLIIIPAVIRMLKIFSQKVKRKALVGAYVLGFLAIGAFYCPVVLALPMTWDYYLWLIRFTGV